MQLELRGGGFAKEDIAFLNGLDRDLLQLIGREDEPIVVDVHTDLNSSQVLEEALNWGRSVTHDLGGVKAIGALTNHYEFKHPMADRLTDASWHNMLLKRVPKMRLDCRVVALFLFGLGLLQAQEPSPYKSAYDAGEALRSSGKFQEALEPYRHARNLAANETQSARGTYRIGEMNANLGETKVAMEWLKKSLTYHRYEIAEEALKKLRLAEWKPVRPAGDIREALLTSASKFLPAQDSHIQAPCRASRR